MPNNVQTILNDFDPTIILPGGAAIHLGGPFQTALAVIAVLIAGAMFIRVTRMFMRGVVRALIAREHLGPGAIELSAAEMKKREDTIEAMVANVVRFFVAVIVGMMVLERVFAVDIGPAVAGLGVAGIAVGMGTQSLVKDYLSGALVLLENQYAVGDVVNLAGISGTVEDFTLRHTKVRDIEGTVHTVPNGQILIASNLTRTWARVHERVSVVYGTDIPRARRVIDEIGREMAAEPEMAEEILEAPKVERIDELGERAVVLLVLGKVRASSQWTVAGEFRHRVLEAFAANGIEMPRAVVFSGLNTPTGSFGATPVSQSGRGRLIDAWPETGRIEASSAPRTARARGSRASRAVPVMAPVNEALVSPASDGWIGDGVFDPVVVDSVTVAE